VELVLKERKVYVPKDKKLKVEIIQLHHDVLVAEYGERWKKMEAPVEKLKLSKILEKP